MKCRNCFHGAGTVKGGASKKTGCPPGGDRSARAGQVGLCALQLPKALSVYLTHTLLHIASFHPCSSSVLSHQKNTRRLSECLDHLLTQERIKILGHNPAKEGRYTEDRGDLFFQSKEAKCPDVSNRYS